MLITGKGVSYDPPISSVTLPGMLEHLEAQDRLRRVEDLEDELKDMKDDIEGDAEAHEMTISTMKSTIAEQGDTISGLEREKEELVKKVLDLRERLAKLGKFSRTMPTFEPLDGDPSYHYAEHEDHSIILLEPRSKSNDWACWYIIVKGPDGGYLYEGGWDDSAASTLQEAFEEACRGAMIP